MVDDMRDVLREALREEAAKIAGRNDEHVARDLTLLLQGAMHSVAERTIGVSQPDDALLHAAGPYFAIGRRVGMSVPI